MAKAASTPTPTAAARLTPGVVAPATSNAYAAGVAAGAASVPAAYAMGVSYAVIPAGCATPSVGGSTYYLCGNTWFKPMYGANGVYYRVVPTP